MGTSRRLIACLVQKVGEIVMRVGVMGIRLERSLERSERLFRSTGVG